ncbi:hypothetical protein ABCR94_03375 [Streptomyces sp. 21So2-11]|uniref:hypothetical protein n=1 Tax=Streptomyces sp. 21So2-11 TaxID=3144408 RepID=UPI00321AFF20
MSEHPTNEADGAKDRTTAAPALLPLGSQERLDHLRIGEALLTDDGRITETPQAKTIAIQAIAQRLRSSTPELVLASMGVVVGTEMADRLGDSRYVLAVHHELYPSMGADVLHNDELDPANPKHAQDRVVRMDDPQADTLVRLIAVSELMGSWSYGSNNNVRVLALQEATREEFGLSEVLEWRMDPKTRFAVDLELDYNRDALREFLRTQYQMTQEVLAARGITEVISYRALSWQEGSGQPDWADLSVGDTVEGPQRPLASWSADRQIVSDWLEQRGGSGMILADRKPAQDIFSIPTTGMGYLAQKEWVTLPGVGRALVDGVFSSPVQASAEQTAASSVSLGAPALGNVVDELAGAPEAALQDADDRWQPFPIVDRIDPSDPFDLQIMRILDGDEDAPDWWPRDDSGYAVTRRDLEFLGIDPVQIKWMLTGEAPMGMTPALYQQFGAEMLSALEREGIDPSQVDIRLKGTSASFFSGNHKTLPREEELVGQPLAVQRLGEWFGDSQGRPLRRPYDAMWRLGLEAGPSDFDLDINSTAIVREARTYWRANQSDRYPGDFMGGHGYLDKQTVLSTLPALAEWASRWEEKLGRPLSLGVFESSGPFDATVLGRGLSSHFQPTDWIVHRPDTSPPRSAQVEAASPRSTASQDEGGRAWTETESADFLRTQGVLRSGMSAEQARKLDQASARLFPLSLLSDSELGARLHQVGRALDAAQQTAPPSGSAGQDLVQVLREKGAPPELVERAARSVQEDQQLASLDVGRATTRARTLAAQQQATAREIERRSGLTPQDRLAEQAGRQRLQAVRRAQQQPEQVPDTPRVQRPQQQPPSRRQSL